MNATPRPVPVSSRRATLTLVACMGLSMLGCSRPYRVGDHVLVEWGGESLQYPAYIIDKKSKSKFRVHYEGYPSRWDEDVGLPRIKGFVEGEVVHPPPPKKVRLARGLDTHQSGDSPVSPFKVGDKVRVRWRETDYRATVLQIVSSQELLVHYDGHETAWDEVVPVSRIVVGR